MHGILAGYQMHVPDSITVGPNRTTGSICQLDESTISALAARDSTLTTRRVPVEFDLDYRSWRSPRLRSATEAKVVMTEDLVNGWNRY